MANPIEPVGHTGVGGPAAPTTGYLVQAEKDMEKQSHDNFNSAELGSHASNDANSEEFQAGVERVRAITAIWTKKTLISMFCL